MLQGLLDRGSGISIVGEASLRRLHQLFPVLSTAYTHGGEPSVTVADDRGQDASSTNSSAGGTHYHAMGAPRVVRVAVAILPRRDDALILGLKTPREKLNIVRIDRRRAQALVHGELA